MRFIRLPLLLSAVILGSPAVAVVVDSVVAQIQAGSSLSAQPILSLTPLLSAAPTAADP